jgi:protein phosphatase
MPILFSGQTNIGMKRKTNQDAITMHPDLNLFIVADGMGGHNGGDVASQLAVQTIPLFIKQNLQKMSDPKTLCMEAWKYANFKIFEKGEADTLLKGMGTTIVGLYFHGKSLFISNIGDSRAYYYQKGSLFQLSRDHSLIQEKINMGLYTREQGANDPQKNVLVRTVGFEQNVEVDVFEFKVSRYDLFLICSDGLHGKVSDRDMVFLINKFIPDATIVTSQTLEQLANELINLANRNGGQDNISVIACIAV